MNDTLDQHLADLQPSATVRHFARSVVARRGAISDRQAGYVSLRPDVDAGRAVYLHKGRVSIAVDPLDAVAAASRMPGAQLDRDTPATTFVVLDEASLSASMAAAVELATESLNWRSTGPRVGPRSGRHQAEEPVGVCPTHNLALLPSGACGWCLGD